MQILAHTIYFSIIQVYDTNLATTAFNGKLKQFKIKQLRIGYFETGHRFRQLKTPTVTIRVNVQKGGG
jgi:hypothetical protein